MCKTLWTLMCSAAVLLYEAAVVSVSLSLQTCCPCIWSSSWTPPPPPPPLLQDTESYPHCVMVTFTGKGNTWKDIPVRRFYQRPMQRQQQPSQMNSEQRYQSEGPVVIRYNNQPMKTICLKYIKFGASLFSTLVCHFCIILNWIIIIIRRRRTWFDLLD